MPPDSASPPGVTDKPSSGNAPNRRFFLNTVAPYGRSLIQSVPQVAEEALLSLYVKPFAATISEGDSVHALCAIKSSLWYKKLLFLPGFVGVEPRNADPASFDTLVLKVAKNLAYFCSFVFMENGLTYDFIN